MADHPSDPPPARRWTPNVLASLAGAAAAAATAAAIWLGSRNLRYFDAALVGYATATVMLASGVVYRYTVWVSSPPARRYLRRGWRAFLSWPTSAGCAPRCRGRW
jgi:hypothetical protein